ncbi:MAG: glutamate mutase L [Planctomycetes bacterium]|nr:glutamate mutase L [Planctomycetota bacterium]
MEKVILATDCGSTTTKAILIELKDGVYRQTFRGESPTTVEAPFEDVTKGVLNSIKELEELSGRKILDGGTIIKPAKDNVGVDIYVSTSSAGGGLQMLVCGVVKQMTATSAQKCALGAGAIVTDVIASNDARQPYEKIDLIRKLRPDMILLSGGTDGGTINHVVELSEYIKAAKPRPRFGKTFNLPVIYAGNKDARKYVEDTLTNECDLKITENLRPKLEVENLDPARELIHELFLTHVMQQAPGYDKLLTWTDVPIMPTPAAVGLIIQKIARKLNMNVIGVDIGGATTDVFSVYEGKFNRTVSANLGMSYSISNVMKETGIENILKWVPFSADEKKVRDMVKNKMIRPTTVPQRVEDLMIEHAISREALRLAFKHHKALTGSLKGVHKERTITEFTAEDVKGEEGMDMAKVDLIVGSGGVLSHAPKRNQSAMMMVDAYEPVGSTYLAVDSIFMMPHLGVLSKRNEKAATEVFEKDCMIFLGTCISTRGRIKPGEKAFSYSFNWKGKDIKKDINMGEVHFYKVGLEEEFKINVEPYKTLDFGPGRGKPAEFNIKGGVVGLIIDARGRPLYIPPDERRIPLLTEYFKILEAYDK